MGIFNIRDVFVTFGTYTCNVSRWISHSKVAIFILHRYISAVSLQNVASCEKYVDFLRTWDVIPGLHPVGCVNMHFLRH